MASSSSQRSGQPNGTRSQRINTIQQPQQPPPTTEDFPVEDVVMTEEAHRDGHKVINQYEFCNRLGRGQHGEVYVAFDKLKRIEVVRLVSLYALPRLVEVFVASPLSGRATMQAIKAVRRKNPKIDRMNQFRKKNLPHSPHTPVTDNLGSTEHKIRKEIAIMKKCNHAHVVRLREVIDDKLSEKIYMVMEYLAGGEIKWRTPSEEPALRVDQTRRICRDVILGLEYLHHQGIIHRDIKPANLLWTADRRMVKIADFGVSHFSYAQHLSASGQRGQISVRDPILMDDSDLSKFAGTPMFLAPEIICDTYTESTADDLDQLATATTAGTSATMTKKKQPITKAIDIWAFGVTLYALLFGKLPFKAEGEYQIYSIIRTEDWDVPETMGCDRIPVGGRHQEAPPPGQETEGYLVVALLEKLLEKEVTKRITLDEVKRHPWILRDMANPEKWLLTTEVKDPLTTTESETRSAISSVRFRWSDTRLVRGISSLVRNVRTSRSRKAPPTLLRTVDEPAREKYKDVGVRSAPQAHLARHKSAAAGIGTRDKGKEVMSQPRRVSPRNETASNASMRSSQTKTSTFEPFAMWAAGNPSGSGRKSRRNSSSSTPALAIDSLQVSSLTVPRRGSSRVGSPQPLTPNSAYGTSYSASQVPSPSYFELRHAMAREEPVSGSRIVSSIDVQPRSLPSGGKHIKFSTHFNDVGAILSGGGGIHVHGNSDRKENRQTRSFGKAE
ncbi:hypothetical protein EUX98_g4585 [Antrodiella citrinella]|uniref:Protein kinase domain-containing protein n=1 Tax=Antrodiella citrinella TaxID=2447956 RepID=A0A4S4MTM1_9APHY|nr:hypothetical protein EUX98_g4585 [Antrodiella citrinella]